MTRSTDAFIPLEERAAFANRFRDGIFVCIHFNAGSDFGTGIETYTLAPRFVPSTGDDSPSASCLMPCAGNVEDPENMALATAMHAVAAEPAADGGPGHQARAVLRAAPDDDPGCADRGRLREQSVPRRPASPRPAYRQAEAEAIALAIQNYQTATNVTGPPPILAETATRRATIPR